LLGARFRLSAHYRCPEGILRLARACLGEQVEPAPIKDALAQGVIGIVECPSRSSVPDKLALEVDKLRSGGLALSDVAILSLRGLGAEGSVARRDSLGRYDLVRADDPRMEANVVADSFLRFKGLERPAILVTDLDLVRDRLPVRMHVALTRALSLVRVVAAKEDLAADPVLRGLMIPG